MQKNLLKISGICGLLALALPLAATEHHGVVKFGGLPVPGVTITMTQGDKKSTAITDDLGSYSFPNLTDGLWNIDVEMLCFESIKREIAVAADAPAPEWDLKLQTFDAIKAAAPPPPPTSAAKTDSAPGASATSSTVATAASTPPPAPKANAKGKKGATAPPTAAQTGFQRAQVNASPGAATAAPADSALTPEETSKGPSEGMLINGSVNNGASSPFAQSPAFGNARRGLRSLYNGSIGGNFSNSVLNASSYSLTGQATPKPSSDAIIFSGSFGGPIRIPHLHQKQPAQFSVQYQHSNSRNGTSNPYLMPTTAQRDGDFSGSSAIIYDPTTHNPFPGNFIPSNRISPQATALLAFYPLPALTNTGYNYQAPITPKSSSNSMQVRINKNLSPRWNMNALFAFQKATTHSPNEFSFLDDTESFGMNSSVNFNHRMGTRMFLNFGVSYSRSSNTQLPYFANLENVSGNAGISGNNQDPINWGPPSLGFSSGIASLTDGNASIVHNQTSAATGSLSWSHSPHNFNFGGDVRRQQFDSIAQSNPRGSFSFTSAATAQGGVVTPGTGSDFADFLLGVPDVSSLAFGNADKYFRSWFDDLYANDDWRVSPSLTLNYGVRWEYNAPIVEKYGRLVNLDIGPGYSAVAPVVANNPVGAITGQHYPDSLINPDKHGFAPKFGLAWRPFPASSFVVRAGYGVNFNSSTYTGLARFMSQQAPLSKSLNVPNSPSNPLTLANGFNASPNVVSDQWSFDPNFRVGYVQTWNVTIQRDMPWALIMTAGYLGNKGTRGQQTFLPNTYPVGAVNPCPTCPVGFYYETTNGNSTRQQGQLQMRRRLRNGLTATATYTYSKSIDDAGLGGSAAGLVAQNWLDLSAERALSGFDQRHLLSFQGQYSTGVGIGGGTLLSGWRGTMVKDWTIVTNVNVGSGLPLSPSCAACVVNNTGINGTVRPEYTGADLYAAPDGRFLNPLAFTTPLLGYWGNAGRNSITGPSQFNMSASMQRTFRLGDRYNADIRLDAANVLNHVVFGSWNALYNGANNSPQFGLAQNPNGMRVVRLNLRVRF